MVEGAGQWVRGSDDGHAFVQQNINHISLGHAQGHCPDRTQVNVARLRRRALPSNEVPWRASHALPYRDDNAPMDRRLENQGNR